MPLEEKQPQIFIDGLQSVHRQDGLSFFYSKSSSLYNVIKSICCCHFIIPASKILLLNPSGEVQTNSNMKWFLKWISSKSITVKPILDQITLNCVLTHASSLSLQSIGNFMQQHSWITIDLAEQFPLDLPDSFCFRPRLGNVSALQN